LKETIINPRFAKYAWIVLAANLLVILWGAYVRATGSGAGCGNHWPLCNGEIVPRATQIETAIEFAHRLSSGAVLLLVIGLVFWAYRQYPKGHPVRLGATLSMIFIITEALVGAGLVLFEWVAKDASIGRVISISVHLVNTFLLLAALTMTAWWASGGEAISFKNRGATTWAFAFGFGGILLIGVTGAITALGDTLFPAGTLAEGIQQDFAATAHFLVRLRVWHPVIAIGVGFYLLFVSGVVGMSTEIRPVRRVAILVIGLVLIQWMAGLVNILLLAPVWMQLIHLLLADLVWISWVLLSANVFTRSAAAGNTIAQNIEPSPTPLETA
jgi:heme A synthase